MLDLARPAQFSPTGPVAAGPLVMPLRCPFTVKSTTVSCVCGATPGVTSPGRCATQVMLRLCKGLAASPHGRTASPPRPTCTTSAHQQSAMGQTEAGEQLPRALSCPGGGPTPRPLKLCTRRQSAEHFAPVEACNRIPPRMPVLASARMRERAQSMLTAHRRLSETIAFALA